MNKKIISKDLEIKKFILSLINQNKSLNTKVEKEVERIFRNIRLKGDNALFNYAKKLRQCLGLSKLVIKFFY